MGFPTLSNRNQHQTDSNSVLHLQIPKHTILIFTVVKKNSAGAMYVHQPYYTCLYLPWVNPQYDNRLFVDSRLQYKKNTSWEPIVYKNCFLFLFWHTKQFLYTTCSQLVFFLYWSQELMNNLSSYCGLTDSRMSASDTTLPV